MLLQKILFPSSDTCNNKDLFFHFKSGCKMANNAVLMEKGDVLEGDSYFNSFSIAKWKKYTILDNLSVSLTLKGDCDLFLCGAYINDKNIICRKNDNLVTQSFSSDTAKEVKLKFDLKNYSMCPLVYIQIKAKGHVELYGGYYYTELDEKTLPDIKIALGICTYHRESFIFKNLSLIERDIYKSNSALKNNLDIIVCDNASTLPVKALSNPHVSVYKNRNYGGSGGFTRCIIEALKREETKRYTHIILMDDDIAIETSVLERTYAFLRLLRKQHADIAIGGAMLVMGDRIRQFENGARLTADGMLSFKNKNLNLTTIRNILVNDAQTGNNYNAWCYCCMPISKITKNNLPLPLFIHMDDVEYGVRNQFEFVNINGICVWHPFQSNMRNNSIVYYDIRNKLIAMASLGGCSLKEYALKWLYTFRSDIFVYNYERFMVACLAIRDFLKGIDNFKRLDPVKLNTTLAKFNKQWTFAPLRHLRNITKPATITNTKKLRLRKILNYILPSVRQYVVRTCDISAADPYLAKKLYICNVAEKKEREYKKSRYKAIKCWIEFNKIKKLIERKMDIVGLEWRIRVKELYSWDFWNTYLGL